MKTTDIVIVGSGIAGLTSAIYLKRANADFVILEGLLPGGLLNSLEVVENYPGFTKTSGKHIAYSLLEQTKQLGIDITYGAVQTILKDSHGFKVVSDSDSYICKAVIVATGINRSSGTLPGEKEYFGRGVSYCATCDGNFYKNGVVAVYGDGETAIEEANYLAGLVQKLYFIVPTDKNVNLNKDNVIVMHHKIKEIKGDDFGVTSLLLDDGNSLEVMGIFPYTGQKTTTQILQSLHPAMNGIFVISDENMKSDIDGLYVAGDIRQKSLKQLVNAASDGAIAAMATIKYIR